MELLKIPAKDLIQTSVWEQKYCLIYLGVSALIVSFKALKTVPINRNCSVNGRAY